MKFGNPVKINKYTHSTWSSPTHPPKFVKRQSSCWMNVASGIVFTVSLSCNAFFHFPFGEYNPASSWLSRGIVICISCARSDHPSRWTRTKLESLKRFSCFSKCFAWISKICIFASHSRKTCEVDSPLFAPANKTMARSVELLVPPVPAVPPRPRHFPCLA